MTEWAFGFFAFTAVISSLLCISRRDPVASAIWLITAMLSLSCIFILLNAQFIGAIQILVYAGAVMVLFLFVIMLLNLGNAPSDRRSWPGWLVAVLVVSALMAQLLPLRHYSLDRLSVEVGGAGPGQATALTGAQALAAATESQGVVGSVATPLFQSYLVPFEIASVLLLVAIIGAVVLAKRRI
jgi:NADH-quinone oxidoreductase subunit J